MKKQLIVVLLILLMLFSTVSEISATTVFLTSDNIIGESEDIDMLNSIKNYMEKLSNGQIYSYFDKGALHYDKVSKRILVGDTFIDNVLIKDNLFILEVDDVPIENISHYIVQDGITEEIGRVDKDKVLENIGGYSAKVDTNNNVLKIKLGKQ